MQSALEASPRADTIRYRLAVAMARTGDVEGALPHFVQSVGDAEAYYHLGIVQFQRALETSEQHFLRALELQPDLDDARYWLSEIQRTRQRMPRVEQIFRGPGRAALLPLPTISPAQRRMPIREARRN